MSIAHGFRSKWESVCKTADATRDQSGDARYSAMARAAEIDGLVLTTKDMINGYQRALEPQFFALGDASGLAVCFGGRWHGWIFKKHPDGHLVSFRKLDAWEGKIVADSLAQLVNNIK